MNDEHTEMTPEELDDLASSHLDGESTTQETVLVSNDPRLQARVEQFRTVKTQMTTPVEPPPNEVRDRMIAQALLHQTPVTDLESARRRRLTPRRVGVALATAAVVAAITVVSMGIIQQNNRDTDDSFATEARTVPSTSATVLENTEIKEKMSENIDIPTSDNGEPVMEAEAEEAASTGWASDDQRHMDDDINTNAYPQSGEAQMSENLSTFDEVPLEFDTLDDLEKYAVRLASNDSNEQRGDMRHEIPFVPDTDCPRLPNEEPELELIARFTAIVEETETEVSVYINSDLILITRTTPPPACRNLDPVLKISLLT